MELGQSIRSRVVAEFSEMVRFYLIEKVAFKQRPEVGEGVVSQANKWRQGGVLWAGIAHAKALGREHDCMCQRAQRQVQP